MARGLRESALWIFGALALILFVALVSYDRADPAFSSTGQPGPVTNLIGPFGAWLSDLFFVLFGGAGLPVPDHARLRRLTAVPRARQPASRSTAARAALRGLGFVLALASSCGLATLHFAGRLAAEHRRRRARLAASATASPRRMSFLGATLLLLAVWLGSVSLSTGVSWLDVMDRIGRGVLRGISLDARAHVRPRRDVRGTAREVKQARQEVVREEQKKVAERKPPKIEAPAPKVEKSERVEKEKQVPLFERPGATALPALSLLDDPPPRARRLFRRGARGDVAPGRAEAARFRRRGRGRRSAPGPGHHALRAAAGAGREGGADLATSPRTSRARCRRSACASSRSSRASRPWASRSRTRRARWSRSARSSSRRPTTTWPRRSRWCSARTSAATRSSPTSRACRTCWSAAPPARASRRRSTRWCCRCSTSRTPEHVRLIMIDPKMLELSVYEGIPHLLAPVVTDMKQAANALRWCVAEMERRYQLMACAGRAQPRGLQPQGQGRAPTRASRCATRSR